MLRVTPINSAESIIEPFWDMHLSGLSEWEIAEHSDIGVRVNQNWCWVDFSWQDRPDAGPTLTMSRRFDVCCVGYDSLVVSLIAPLDSVVRITAVTNIGPKLLVSEPSPKSKCELSVDITGASTIENITIEVFADHPGSDHGWFNWIGLQDSVALAGYLRQWDYSEISWESYLKPADYVPAFSPQHGIFVSSEDLNQIWVNVESNKAVSAWLDTIGIDELRTFSPEDCIGEYVNLGADERYNRVRDHGKILMGKARIAALAGSILRDANLLKIAARSALSIAMCEYWDDGFICRFPGSTFEHRAFTQSSCAHDIAVVLDMAGDMFTDLGRELLLRRLSEQAISSINYNTWKHEYIFECNQLMLFSAGRLLAYLIMECYWPRVRQYTDIAYSEVIESLSKAIAEDGSFLEGPSYFSGTIDQAFLCLTYYARARKTVLWDSLPECITKMENFGEVINSTDNSRDVMRICDAGKDIGLNAVEWLAAAVPNSYWTSIYRRMVSRGKQSSSILMGNHSDRIPNEGPAPRNLVVLQEMGVVSSLRVFDEKEVKILVMGNRTNAGHCHEDKGSFILEFAGETFADDPGTFNYSDPRAEMACECEWHNMLVPYGQSLHPHPDNPLQYDIKPEAFGDDSQFRAKINAGLGWNNVYDYWNRTWDSPNPKTLIISDDYKLNVGEGVQFFWITALDVNVHGSEISINGSKGMVVLHVPNDCQISVNKSPDFGGAVYNRISLLKNCCQGTLVVNVMLC